MKYIGVDQHGQFFPIEKNSMYVDTVQGGTKHIGYVIGPQWVRVLKVEPFKN